MGVRNLHRLLEPACTMQRCADAPGLARSFGVNAMAWVHTHSEDGVVPHLLRCIEPFRAAGVTLHIVFDGSAPAASAGRKQGRFSMEDKVLMRQQLEQVMRVNESYRRIHVHTACYEADSHLAALAAAGTIDAIVAHDSDVVVRLALAGCERTLVLFDWSKTYNTQCKVLSVQDVIHKQPVLSSAAHLLFAAVVLGCDYNGSELHGFGILHGEELHRRGILRELDRADISLPERVARAVEVWGRSSDKQAETAGGRAEKGKERVQREKQGGASADAEVALVINEYRFQPVYGLDAKIMPMTAGGDGYNETPAVVLDNSEKLAALLRAEKPLGPELEWMTRVADRKSVAAMRKLVEGRSAQEEQEMESDKKWEKMWENKREKEREKGELVADAEIDAKLGREIFDQMHDLLAL